MLGHFCIKYLSRDTPSRARAKQHVLESLTKRNDGLVVVCQNIRIFPPRSTVYTGKFRSQHTERTAFARAVARRVRDELEARKAAALKKSPQPHRGSPRWQPPAEFRSEETARTPTSRLQPPLEPRAHDGGTRLRLRLSRYTTLQGKSRHNKGDRNL